MMPSPMWLPMLVADTQSSMSSSMPRMAMAPPVGLGAARAKPTKEALLV